MRIAVTREIDANESRVAATPETVKKMKALGAEIVVEPDAGTKSGIPDPEFAAAGATVTADAVKDADVVLKVSRPAPSITVMPRPLISPVRPLKSRSTTLSL